MPSSWWMKSDYHAVILNGESTGQLFQLQDSPALHEENILQNPFSLLLPDNHITVIAIALFVNNVQHLVKICFLTL